VGSQVSLVSLPFAAGMGSTGMMGAGDMGMMGSNGMGMM